MKYRCRLVVVAADGTRFEPRVRSAVKSRGGTVETVGRAEGEWGDELIVTFLLSAGTQLHEVVQAIEAVRGAAVSEIATLERIG